jgi:hypothetical protein
MALTFRWWPFANRSPARPSIAGPSSGPAPQSSQSARPGLLKRAGKWIVDNFKGPAQEASAIARRTGQTVVRDAMMHATLKLLISRMQRDLEALATICREQIATLRRRRFGSLDTLEVSYMRVFTLTDELRRYVISYAEDLQRPSLAQFAIQTVQPVASGSSALTTSPPSPSVPVPVAAPLASSAEIADLAPSLALADHKNIGRGYLKRRATALAGIYQLMLDTVESIEHELHKSRPISELELITLAQRLNTLVVRLIEREIAFGHDLMKGEPLVVAKLEDLARNIAGQ